MLSIIIPIYNVSPFLKQCVDSVISQSYRDIEILLVDDGSTDDCGAICDAYAAMDSRIKVIHKENGGLSDARNYGVSHSLGEYIFFLDGDDFLEKNAIDLLLDTAQEEDADLVVGNYLYTYKDHENCATNLNSKIVYNRRDAIKELMAGNIQTFAWGKLIRASIVKKHEFPKGKLFEDHFWTHLVFNECEKIVCIDAPVVHYRQRDNSISYTMNLGRLDILNGFEDRISFLKALYPELLDSYLERCGKDVLNQAWLVIRKMHRNKRIGLMRLGFFSKKNSLESYAQGVDVLLLRVLKKNICLFVTLFLIRRLCAKV